MIMTVETFVTPKVLAKLELLFKEELYGKAHRLDCGTYKSDLSSITKCDLSENDCRDFCHTKSFS